MYEYTLLRGNPNDVPGMIAKYAQEGWRVVGFTAGGPINFELFTLLEREKK